MEMEIEDDLTLTQPSEFLDEDDDLFAGYILKAIDRGETLLRTMGWNGKGDGSGSKRPIHVPNFNQNSNNNTESNTNNGRVVFVGRRATQVHETTAKRNHFGLGYSGSLRSSSHALQSVAMGSMGGISIGSSDSKIEYSQSIGFSSDESDDDDMQAAMNLQKSNLAKKHQQTRCVDGTLALIGFHVYSALLSERPFALDKIAALVVPTSFNSKSRQRHFANTPVPITRSMHATHSHPSSSSSSSSSISKSTASEPYEMSKVLSERFTASTTTSTAYKQQPGKGDDKSRFSQSGQFGLQLMGQSQRPSSSSSSSSSSSFRCFCL